MISIQWMILFCHLLGLILGHYDDLPKIKSQNGHLILESGLNRTITFRMIGRGRMRINNVDIVNLMNQTSNRLSQSPLHQDLKYINISLYSNEAKINGPNGIMNRLGILESYSLNSTNSQNRVIVPRQFIRQFQALELRVETIFTRLTEDNCRSVPCQNGGTCIDLYDSFQCQCSTNWQGRLCDEDVNECANFAGTDLGCQNGAICINRPGSYLCQCRDNFRGMHCTRKIKDCSSASSYELCGQGICINSNNQNGYQCLCNAGWKLNTPSIGVSMCIEDINECASNIPHCSVDPPVVCRNLQGSYTCGPCPVGFTGSGFYCVDVNECEMNNGGCSTSPSVMCHNTRGSFYCDKCPLGYVGDGRMCIRNSNTCETSNLCHPLATCVEDGSGNINCVCRDGLTGNGLGNNGCNPVTSGNDCSKPNCQLQPPSPCESNPCENGGTCRITQTQIQYSCNCAQGFTGQNCNQNLPFCGGTKDGDSGTIKYPPEGIDNYQPNERCAWLIKTQINKVLNITFTQFHLEESSECQYDWLQIHDGRTTAARNIGRFCGTQLPLGGNFISTHNLVYLWFRSDHSTSHAGFNLSWKSIDPQCGEIIETNSHGTISSPGSPGNYPIDRNCFWYIKAPPGKRFQLHFYTMKIEIHPNCNYDFVRVFHGSLPEVGDEDSSTIIHNVPIIAEFCNTTIPVPVTTPANEITIYFHSDGDGSDSGFQIHYTVINGIAGCGGVFTNKKGVFGTPDDEDGDYPSSITCEYLIQLPINSKVMLFHLTVDIEPHSDCRMNFLKIFDGGSDQSPIISTFCGQKVPIEIMSSTNKLFMRFKSDWSQQRKGFRTLYNTVCGGRFNTETGVITSPSYPSPYDANQICHFYIETPLNTAIILQFTDFDLKGNYVDGNDCMLSSDAVLIDDQLQSDVTQISRYCGNYLPPIYRSATNYLHLEFHSDYSLTGRGFKANYSTIATKCGGIMKNNNGVIRPPEEAIYELGYSHSIRCLWNIVAPIGQAIQLQFSSFDLEASSASCDHDYLQLFDGTSNQIEIGKFCGHRTPPAITSSDNILTLIFQTDSSRNGAGFSATYNFIDTRTMCGGNLFSPFGYIRSPGWPSEYQAGKTCQWIIQVPKGHQVTLKVIAFDLRQDNVCQFDWLEIRNGGSEMSPLIGKFCGTQFPNNTIRSFGNKLFLRSVSDTNLQHGKGFVFEYNSGLTGCGGKLTSYRGVVSSPLYPDHYDADTVCSWQIIVNPGSCIEMIFTDLDMQSLADCYHDYIEIYDGNDVSGKKIGKFCHPESRSLRIVTNSNAAFLRMKSDGSENGRGFNINYQTVCTRIIIDMYGIIESPNFPNQYPANITCEWKIQGPKGSKILIEFSHFDLQRTNECTTDFVAIIQYNSTQEGLPTKYCDRMPSDVTSLFGNMLTIKFQTGSSRSGHGFRLEYRIEGCGGILTKPSGSIVSPNYPDHYPIFTQCKWQIEAEPGNSIELTVHNLLIEDTRECSHDYLLISQNPANSSHYLRKMCGSMNSTQIITVPRIMYLTFESDFTITGMGFNATYQFIPQKCGGLYRSIQGILLSPNYPDNYPPDVNCEYFIEVQENHLIELNLIDFNVAVNYNLQNNNEHCPDDRVLIYDGPNRTNNLLLTHCGTQLPNTTKYISSTNKMLVVFETDRSRELSGFKFNYIMSCGTTITVNGSGKIEMPSGLDIQGKNCTWHLKAPDETQHITFNVGHITGFEQLNYNILTGTYTCMIVVEIYDGDTTDAPIKNRNCGAYDVLRSVTSTGQYLTINLHVPELKSHAKPKINFVGFYSIFDSSCGGQFNMINGKIASPEYPHSYPSDIECTWKINSAPGNWMHLVVSDMNILSTDNICNEDYLEVRQKDEAGELLGVYCGDKPVSNLTSIYGFWIKFRSGTIGVARGFLAQFFYNEHSEIRGEEGEIGSPLYPEMYQGYWADYTWRITVPPKSIISLTFIDFIIDAYSRYCSVTLRIYDGYNKEAPELSSKFCGTEMPEPLKSSSNVLLVHLAQNSGIFGTKFLLKWKAVGQNVMPITPLDTDKNCGNKTIQVTDPKQLVNFTSPGWPDGYDNSLKYSYVISTNLSSYHTKFTLDDIDLEDSEGCVSDYVQISSSNDFITWTLLAKKCGTNFFESSLAFEGKPYLKIDFVTNYAVNKTGFSGVVSLDCGNIMRGSNGLITYNSNQFLGMPLLYKSNVCMWNITVSVGHTIRYSFERFNFTTSIPPNCESALMFKNGIDDSSPILGLGKYCGTTMPEIPMTISNRGFIKLTSKLDDVVDFELKYEQVGIDCNDNLQLTHDFNRTVITTPNYPNIPQPHSECTWIINVPNGEYIKIEFLDVNLIHSEGCRTEYIEIRMGATKNAPLVNRFCGNTQPKFILKNSIGSIKYYTSSDTPHNGFKMLAQIAPCGAIYEGNSAVINSPNYRNGGYDSNMACEYHVITLPGTYINFTFIDIHLPIYSHESSDSQQTYCDENIEIFTVRPNDNLDSSINYNLHSLGRFCGETIPPPIITEGNEAFIKFTTNRSQGNYDGGWSLQYIASVGSCGGRLNTDSGVITSPGYPYNGMYLNCNWYITVPKGRRITVIIVDLDFTIMADPRTRLVFYNDHTLTSRIVVINSDSSRHNIYSSDNKLGINYWMNPLVRNRRGGFVLSYTSYESTICVGDLNNIDGIIKQPDNQTQFVCEYLRTGSSFYIDRPNVGTIALEFTGLKFPGLNSQLCLPTASKISVFIDNDNEIATICKNNSITVRSPVPNVKVVSKKNIAHPLMEFKLDYKVHRCGGIKSRSVDDEIIVKQTGFEQNYGKLDCAWQINFGENEKIMANILKLSFRKPCDNEYIIIYQGDTNSGPPIVRYCESTPVPKLPIVLQTHQLFLEYHTDQYTSESEFEIRFNSSSMFCGGVLKHSARFLASPKIVSNNSIRYPHNAECIWDIESRIGSHVGLVFTNRFNLEQSDNCTNDYVEVFDYIDGDWRSLGRVCGRTKPPPFNSTSTRMRVIFRSNNIINGDGFTAKWLENCGGIFKASATKQYITSPGYPEIYLPFSMCNYTIIASAIEYIDIEFEDFQLEESGTDCRYDNVTLYQVRVFSNPPQLKKQGTYCGKQSPGILRLNEQLVIEFKTDSNTERSGFRVSYQIDTCGGLITQPGQIRTPRQIGDGKYPNSRNCFWIINPNNVLHQLKRISITFDMMELEHSQRCLSDYIAIYQGIEFNNNNRIAKLCGNDTGHTITIDSDKGSVYFQSDSVNSFRGFIATVSFTEYCDRKIELSDSLVEETISMDGYRPYMNCHYSVTAPAGTIIKLTFNNFHISHCAGQISTKSCTCSYLEVRDGLTPFSELIGRYCGHTVPEPITSSISSLYIIFVTDGMTNNGGGFLLQVQKDVSICGQTYYNITDNDQSFEIKSPGGDTYPPNIICRWTIESPKKRTTEVYFTKFDLEDMGDIECSNDVLEITDATQKNYIGEGLGTELVYSGQSNNSRFLSFYVGMQDPIYHSQYCGSFIPMNYFSYDNKIQIKFQTNANIERSGFTLRARLSHSCERNYTSTQGRIKHEGLNECAFWITAPVNYTLSIFFLNIYYPEMDCPNNGIKIYENGPNGKLVLHLCRYYKPRPLFLTTNQVYISSSTSSSESGEVYPPDIITYDFYYLAQTQGQGPGCGGDMYNYGGTFSSPGYPANDRNSSDCRWNIIVPVHKVALRFVEFDMGPPSTCDTNYVEILEINGEGKDTVARTYCGGDTPAVYRGLTNKVSVRLQKTVNFAGTGFEVQFMAAAENAHIKYL